MVLSCHHKEQTTGIHGIHIHSAEMSVFIPAFLRLLLSLWIISSEWVHAGVTACVKDQFLFEALEYEFSVNVLC